MLWKKIISILFWGISNGILFKINYHTVKLSSDGTLKNYWKNQNHLNLHKLKILKIKAEMSLYQNINSKTAII